jgi:hypothetical protein
MPWGATAGIQTPYTGGTNANVIPYDVMRLAIDWFPNRAPLFSRLAKVPLGAMSFYMNSDNYRPRTDRITAAYTSAGASLTVADTTQYTVGDVILIESERFRVTAIANATTLTVSGAQEGTSQANHANNTALTLITNARTGGDVDQNALHRIPSSVAQYAQTVQHAYQIGGSYQSATNYMGGNTTPLDRDRMMAMQHVIDDFEIACCLGEGAALSSTMSNQTMKGLKKCLTTNNVTSPTNLSAYKPSDFIRDTLQACNAAGGSPDTLLVSSGFLTGFSVWGWNLQYLQPEANALGISPKSIVVPFLNGVQIIESPLLKTVVGSDAAIAFNSQEVRLAIKRPLFENRRGSRGDAIEGDFILEGAIDVENEYKHAWVQGITGWAVQS